MQLCYACSVSSWKREAARDLRALGSPVFYALATVRIAIDGFTPYLHQFLIATGVLFLLSLLFKSADLHVARALVLAVLISLFYRDLPFAVFVGVLFLVLLYISRYLDISIYSIGQGIIAGAVSAGVGYVGAGFL